VTLPIRRKREKMNLTQHKWRSLQEGMWRGSDNLEYNVRSYENSLKTINTVEEIHSIE